MVDAARHPKIKVKTYTNVERVEGYVGNFKVQLREKSRFVTRDTLQRLRRLRQSLPDRSAKLF